MPAGLFIGMDEAGYGPNLGPLLIAMTCWKTPGPPHQCDFYELLKASVAANGTARGRKLHLADSKQVNTGKEGFRSLECSALALLHCLGLDVGSFDELLRQLTGSDRSSPQVSVELSAPWYAEVLPLPVAACPQQVREQAQRLQNCLEQSGLELLRVQVEMVEEHRFNRMVMENGDNKGRMLSRLAFRLLRANWSPADTCATLIVGDKHGGRNRYDELLAEVLGEEMIFRLEEGQQLSRYRVGRSELRFQVGGERHLPVACASIIAKYLRELAMKQFNQFWNRHCPDVKPTLGYPNDARRFRTQVEQRRCELQIADEIFWRMK